MKKTILIDLSAVFRRHYHATEHEPVSAAFERTVKDVHEWASHGDHAAVCIDMPPYLRKELYPAYKEHREKQPQQMYGQLDAVIERLRKDGLLVVGAKGYEADDVIATFAAGLPDHEIEIVTSDKDALQLVSDRVRVLSNATGSVMTPADVKAKLGVGPELVAEWIALVGDKSDNIPGVKGIGAKGAAKLLTDFGSLRGVYGNLSKLSDRIGVALAEAATTVKTAVELVKLRTDAPIDVTAIYQRRAPEPVAEGEPPPPDEEPPPPEETEAPPSVPAAPQAAAANPPAAGAPSVPAPVTKANGNGNSNGHMPFDMALEPKNQAQAWDLAMRLFNSKLFMNYPTTEAIYAAILTGRSLGLTAMAAVRAFHVMRRDDGGQQLTLGAWPMVGVVLAHPSVCQFFRCVEADDSRATWETRRMGHDKTRTFTYTIEQAQQAGLVRETRGGRPNNWMMRPADMLSKTAASKLAREVYSDIIQGLYSTEEMEGV